MTPTPRKLLGLVLFYDGTCGLCNAAVQYILVRDKQRTIRFAPLQGKLAEEILPREKITHLDSMIFFKNGVLLEKSEAALEIACHLGGGLKLVSYLRFLPQGFRNPIYDWIAKHRYQIFGRNEVCFIPSKKDQSRFLE